ADTCAEACGRRLDGVLRPRARLIEQGDDGPSSQRAGRSFPVGIGLGGVEQLLDLGGAKFSQTEQVPAHHEPPKAKGRRKRDESRGKKEEGRNKNGRGDVSPAPFFPLPFSFFPCTWPFQPHRAGLKDECSGRM